MSDLYTDDDVQRGEDALFAAWGLPEKLARRGARMDTQTVLDAVLPAYRKRLLLDLADAIHRGPTFPIPPSVISALLREKAEETP